jgi:hypothetical protein
MSYLGIWVPPTDLTLSVLSAYQKQRVQELIPQFPDMFDRARDDWAKFQVGLKRNLFTPGQQKEILDWFREFPSLWETVRPNFINTPEGQEWGGTVDDFIGAMKREPVFRETQLGLVGVIVVGTVLVVGGVAAALWAISYMEKQQNISKMIDQVTAGALPPEVLAAAVKEEKTGGLFAGLAEIGSVLALAVGGWFAWKLVRAK